MAILDDVNQGLVDLIAGVVYPNGPTQPSAIAAQGLLGPIQIFPGWPAPEDVLDPDMRPYAEGGDRIADISVVDFGASRSTTRFALYENVQPLPAPTLAWTISGNTATLAGNITVPQNLCISANKIDYVIAVQATSGLNDCINQLVALMPVGTTSHGASLTIAGLNAARVGVVTTTQTEVGRQCTPIRVGIYTGEKSVSMALVRLIKPVLDSVSRIQLPDTSVIHVQQGVEMTAWPSTKTGVRTKTLIYPVEHPSLALGTAAEMIAWVLNVSANGGPVVSIQG